MKRDLILRIADLNDKSVLDAINKIVDSQLKPTIYSTNSEQRKNIQEGHDQIAAGQSYTNEQIEQEIDNWLKEK